MKTTLNIPEDLIEEALKLGGIKNKTMAIIISLQEYINKKKIEKLRSLRGKLKLDIDLKSLRKRRFV